MPTLQTAENRNTQDVRIKRRCQPFHTACVHLFVSIALIKLFVLSILAKTNHSIDMKMIFYAAIECCCDCTREEIWDERTVIISSFRHFHITRQISQRLCLVAAAVNMVLSVSKRNGKTVLVESCFARSCEPSKWKVVVEKAAKHDAWAHSECAWTTPYLHAHRITRMLCEKCYTVPEYSEMIKHNEQDEKHKHTHTGRL